LFLEKKVLTGWLCVLLLLTVVRCTVPGSTKPILKVGLVAPFEGLYRPLGYKVLYAVKLAIRERNASGGVAGYMVELVALNDDSEPTIAAQRAREMAVMAVIRTSTVSVPATTVWGRRQPATP